MNRDTFDIIVIGSGHAGIEAACVASGLGVNCLLVTYSKENLGEMSCNPSIGGIGKGHLVKEIDALGGIMAHAADHAGIQFRILNAKKGPAVRATRAQIDRKLYKKFICTYLEKQKNITIVEEAVAELMIENEKIVGVITEKNQKYFSQAVVLTPGTFLNGKIHIGAENFSAGRIHEPASIHLAQFLKTLPLNISRLKTGTPPRLDKNTIDFSRLLIQPGDTPTPIFSFLGNAKEHPTQIPCHIAHTNEKTHEMIRANLKESALFSGAISGVGPRYCPSIEDKIVRFADKKSHQIFVEPEGLDSSIIYPNGISTSLSKKIQDEFVHSIEGFENVKITRYGYAIEYDFIDPRDVKLSLETKKIHGLFLAGQILGTTGYEEAAALGLIAGLNAVKFIRGEESWTPLREESYIGVMIDDLITKGTSEPYRMFTSRAEYRLTLREDNADLRLTQKGYELGLVDQKHFELFSKKREQIAREQERLKKTWIQPGTEKGNLIEKILGQKLLREYSLMDLLKRPELNYQQLMAVSASSEPLTGSGSLDADTAIQVEIQAKYAGYIDRQQQEIARQLRLEHTRIPEHFDYEKVKGLSIEVKQKLKQHKPETIGMASRIPGVTPAAISILLVYLKK